MTEINEANVQNYAKVMMPADHHLLDYLPVVSTSTNANGTLTPLDPPLDVSFFKDSYAKRIDQEAYSLRGLLRVIKGKEARTKAELPLLKLARFGKIRTDKGSLRHDDNVEHVSGIEADYDEKNIPVDFAIKILSDAKVAAMVYTSPSHTPRTPRWRVLAPTSRKTRHRGLDRVGWIMTLTAAAANLIRLPKLLGATS